MYAEALIETGDASTAVGLINEVRSRSFPEGTPVDGSADLKEALIHERRVELWHLKGIDFLIWLDGALHKMYSLLKIKLSLWQEAQPSSQFHNQKLTGVVANLARCNKN